MGAGKTLNKPANWLFEGIPSGLIGDITDNGDTITVKRISLNKVFLKLNPFIYGGEVRSISSVCTSSNINKWAAFKPTTIPFRENGLARLGNEIVYIPPSNVYRLGDFAAYNHNARAFEPVGPTEITYPSSQVGTTITRYVQLTLPEFDFRTEIQGLTSVAAITTKTVVGGITREKTTALDLLFDPDHPSFYPSQLFVEYDVYVAYANISFDVEVWLADQLLTKLVKLDTDLSVSGSQISIPEGTIRSINTDSGRSFEYIGGVYLLSTPKKITIQGIGYNQGGLFLGNKILNVYVRGVESGAYQMVGSFITPKYEYTLFQETFTFSHTSETTIDVLLTEGSTIRV